jgi:hypothetical protein
MFNEGIDLKLEVEGVGVSNIPDIWESKLLK